MKQELSWKRRKTYNLNNKKKDLDDTISCSKAR